VKVILAFTFSNPLKIKVITPILILLLSYLNVQISDAATKEYNLEKSMQMMVEEWSDMEFSIEPYGETGTYTLSSVDSIQVKE
jgi:hypothetical protein